MVKRTLQEVTNINFRRSLDAKDVAKLLQHVSQDAKCSVRYSETVKVEFGDPVGQESNRTKRDVVDIHGAMHPYNNSVVLSEFILKMAQEPDTPTHFEQLRFQTIVGYDLDELDKREVAFMDRVRASIEKYFS